MLRSISITLSHNTKILVLYLSVLYFILYGFSPALLVLHSYKKLPQTAVCRFANGNLTIVR